MELKAGEQPGLPADDALAADPQELARQALTNRPLFRVAVARYEGRVQQLRAEEAKRWPWVGLAAIPHYRHNDYAARPNDFSVAVDVTVPIFDLNTGNIAAADAARMRAQDEFAAAVANVRRDTALACSELQARTATLKRYRESILPTLDEQEKILDAAFHGQNVDLATLLAAQDTVLRIRREYIEVRLQHHKAWLDLARTVGALPGAMVKGP